MRVVHALLAALLLIDAPVADAGVEAPPAQAFGRWSLADMNRDCPACTDFYEYANGGWLEKATIPAGRSTYSTYQEVGDKVEARLQGIVDEAVLASRSGDTSIKGKIGTYWTSCMDEPTAERDGVRPLAADLGRIDAIRTREDLAAEVRRLNLVLPEMLFWTDVAPDPLHPQRMMVRLSQGGLSLPEVAMYADNGTEGTEARGALRKAVVRMFELSGLTANRARDDASSVIALETELARSSRQPEALRDTLANYHPMTVEGANRLTPGWDWKNYLQTVGAATGSAPIDLGQPEYFTAMAGLLSSRPIAEWRAYLRWHLLRRASPWLSKPFRDTRRELSAYFTGAKGEPPRSKLCMEALNYSFGWAIGDIYRQRYFTPETKRRADRMVANLKAAMGDRIRAATWMTEPTRRKALRKLAAVEVYLGGPARIPDYGSFRVVSGPFWGNMSEGYGFVTRTATAKLGKPVDRTEWYQLPQQASGAADFERNQFQYPAAKFTPPFFDPNVDDALNYGALGATLGHELTHLFDDRGRKHDQSGRLRDWWTAADAAAYERRAKRLVAAYDRYPVAGEKLNGALTSSENIADLGGLTIAYYALQRELSGKPRRTIDGFTPEQRFFLAWARNFRELISPEQLKRQIRSDEHAPSKARVNLPLANMPEFRRAFGCKQGDAMFRPSGKQVGVW
jgi:putative endopeptidase